MCSIQLKLFLEATRVVNEVHLEIKVHSTSELVHLRLVHLGVAHYEGTGFVQHGWDRVHSNIELLLLHETFNNLSKDLNCMLDR